MLTSQNAYDLAKSYSKDLGEILPDIYLDVEFRKEYSNCFYFDFNIVDKYGNKPKQPPMIGGAPGVIVDKLTGAIKTISLVELFQLK
jgi:hypothetical protein